MFCAICTGVADPLKDVLPMYVTIPNLLILGETPWEYIAGPKIRERCGCPVGMRGVADLLETAS